MVNNEYLGLIRQAELPYDMNFAVDLHYGEGGIDHVKLMDAFGCPARRVDRPEDIAGALAWATAEAEHAQVPVLVEVMVNARQMPRWGPLWTTSWSTSRCRIWSLRLTQPKKPDFFRSSPGHEAAGGPRCG
ncbi:thiamine pyrophosphate-dependent enzyme [Fodinicola feengrottensis]|nr:thiamine pyrophosphate-dependent enzyme [Fodinicola feengrottensis]